MKNNNLKIEDNSINKIDRLTEAIAFYEENFNENDDSQTNMSLHPNATHADKAKYQLCDDIFEIQIRYKLTDKETAKRLKTDEEIVKQINHHHYDKFTYEELSNYAQKLAEFFEEEIITHNEYVKSYQHADHHMNLNFSTKSNNKTISMI